MMQEMEKIRKERLNIFRSSDLPLCCDVTIVMVMDPVTHRICVRVIQRNMKTLVCVVVEF